MLRDGPARRLAIAYTLFNGAEFAIWLAFLMSGEARIASQIMARRNTTSAGVAARIVTAVDTKMRLPQTPVSVVAVSVVIRPECHGILSCGGLISRLISPYRR